MIIQGQLLIMCHVTGFCACLHMHTSNAVIMLAAEVRGQWGACPHKVLCEDHAPTNSYLRQVGT